jgi:hypothetical protein
LEIYDNNMILTQKFSKIQSLQDLDDKKYSSIPKNINHNIEYLTLHHGNVTYLIPLYYVNDNQSVVVNRHFRHIDSLMTNNTIRALVDAVKPIARCSSGTCDVTIVAGNFENFSRDTWYLDTVLEPFAGPAIEFYQREPYIFPPSQGASAFKPYRVLKFETGEVKINGQTNNYILNTYPESLGSDWYYRLTPLNYDGTRLQGFNQVDATVKVYYKIYGPAKSSGNVEIFVEFYAPNRQQVGVFPTYKLDNSTNIYYNNLANETLTGDVSTLPNVVAVNYGANIDREKCVYKIPLVRSGLLIPYPTGTGLLQRSIETGGIQIIAVYTPDIIHKLNTMPIVQMYVEITYSLPA